MFHLIAIVVVLSILAHSSSDVPIAHYFARQRARQVRDAEAATLNAEDTDDLDQSAADPPANA